MQTNTNKYQKKSNKYQQIITNIIDGKIFIMKVFQLLKMVPIAKSLTLEKKLSVKNIKS